MSAAAPACATGAPRGDTIDQPLQPAVFFLQPTEFADAEVDLLLFPGVQGLLGDAELPADITDGGARFGLPEGVEDLLFRES